MEAGRGKDIGLIYESAYTKQKNKYSFSDLQDKISKLSRILSNNGIKKGDTVVIYMPMIPEAFIAMHAVARIGAIHCVVFGGFAPEELSSRLTHTKAKMIITASTGIEPNKLIPYIGNVDKACQLAGIPELKRIIVQRPEHLESNLDSKVYLDYYEEMAKVQTGHDCVPVEGEHPFFTMYTSGTTG